MNRRLLSVIGLVLLTCLVTAAVSVWVTYGLARHRGALEPEIRQGVISGVQDNQRFGCVGPDSEQQCGVFATADRSLLTDGNRVRYVIVSEPHADTPLVLVILPKVPSATAG